MNLANVRALAAHIRTGHNVKPAQKVKIQKMQDIMTLMIKLDCQPLGLKLLSEKVNTTRDGSRGIAIKLNHGVSIAWGGCKIFHYSMVGNVGVNNDVYGTFFEIKNN